jgi:hypothetical protein
MEQLEDTDMGLWEIFFASKEKAKDLKEERKKKRSLGVAGSENEDYQDAQKELEKEYAGGEGHEKENP